MHTAACHSAQDGDGGRGKRAARRAPQDRMAAWLTLTNRFFLLGGCHRSMCGAVQSKGYTERAFHMAAISANNAGALGATW